MTPKPKSNAFRGVPYDKLQDGQCCKIVDKKRQPFPLSCGKATADESIYCERHRRAVLRHYL